MGGRLRGGFNNAKGVLTANCLKYPTDPTWKDAVAYKDWL